MKFLSDILAKAGLTVDGVVTLNNTATGQTPNANDNSTKLATTAWVRTFVQPYSLPIASDSILGGIKVGSGLSIDPTTGVLTASGGGGGNLNFRTIQEFIATAGQTTFTISGGYTVGYVEVLINGVYLSESLYTATNGTTIVLDDAVVADDIVTVFLYSLYNLGSSIYARNVDTLTATEGQTTFTTSYIPGQIDVYYNGSKLTAAEYTATNGSSIVLAQAAVLGDIIEVVTYLAGAGINASRTLTINGTTYDLTANRTWTLTTSNITEGTNLYYTDTRVGSYLTTNLYATQSYVSTQINNLINGAPGLLDTLDELAAALGDDANFASTITTSIGTKVPQARTITINGTSYDLSADRSWSIAAGVTSFNTRTGDIIPASGDYTTAQVTESGNLYYTNTRARLAISLTTTGTSGAATYDSATGILNIPQYQGGVTSFNTRTGAITLSSSDVTTALTYTPVTNARTISINGTSYDLSADRSWTIAPDVSVRNTYAFTATANQTTFTVTGGYSVGLVDVFINGVKLAAADFTATNGTTVVLGTGTGVGNIVEIVKYVSAFTTAQEALNGTGLVRMSGTTVTYDNATYATQSYVTTAVANLVNSAPSTLDTLNELATALGNDANFATTITTSIATKQPQLNGTGFVKISGTTISYDNSTYLTTASASTTYLPLTGGTLTGPLGGTSASFSSSVTAVTQGANSDFNAGAFIARASGSTTKYTQIGFDATNTYGWIQALEQGVAYRNLILNGAGGNVLIGTTSDAGYKLDVNGTTRATRMIVGGTATSRILQVNTSGNDGIRIQTSGDNPTLDLMQTAAANAGARNWRIVTNWEGWGTMDFQSGTNNTNDPSTTRLSISGTTGAATFSSSVSVNGLATSANYKLGVTGAAYISGTNSKGIFITDSAYYASIVGLNSAISAYNALELRASGTDYQLYLHTNGNVGVLNDNPGYTLDVSGNCAATRFYVSSGGNATDPMIRDKTYTSTGIYFPSANAMAITNGGTQSVLFQADGITKVSHLRTSTLYSEFSINLNGAYTSGTYYKICDSSQLTSGGIYMIVAYVDTYAIGGGLYFCTFASVPFYWFAGGSNSGSIQTLPTMLGTGHHNLNPPIVRIRLSTVASSDGGKQFLEFDPNANWSNVQGTSGATVTFYVKRIGS